MATLDSASGRDLVSAIHRIVSPMRSGSFEKIPNTTSAAPPTPSRGAAPEREAEELRRVLGRRLVGAEDDALEAVTER